MTGRITLPGATLLVVLASSLVVSKAAAGLTSKPSDAALRQWTEQLDDDDRSQRDAAEAKLIAAGKPACEMLRAASSDPRPEVRSRALRALREIELFLLPDVSDDALSIAQAYLTAPDADHRKQQLNRLFQLQPPANAVLTRLIPLEDDEDLVRQILYQLRSGYRDAVPRMLVDDNDLPAVLRVLNLSAEMWGQATAADDATALQLSGQIDQQIAVCLAEQTNGDTIAKEHAATQLCFLYRALGKSDLALNSARLSRDQSLVFLVLQDQGDWSGAAKEPDDRWREPIVAAAYRAGFERLAGHQKAAVEIMSSLAGSAAVDADGSFNTSRLFLLNDLPQRGIELLEEQHPAVAFEMRLQRGEIAQAIAIAEKYRKHPRDGAVLQSLHDDLRRNLGELPQPTTQPELPAEPAPGPVDRAWQQAVADLQQKKYQAAADAFAALWKIDRTHFDRLFLQGFCLQQAGQTELGAALMQKAQILPLGDPLHRWQFAAQLDAAGLTDIAEQQRDIGLRGGGDFDEVGFSEIYNTQAENAIEHRQWHAAADALDRLCLINLSAQVQWHDSLRLLTVPALAHLIKARDAREQHDFPAMTRELQAYQQYLPASADMVLEMVPALDALDQHQLADDLFQSVYEKIAATCRAYPQSVTYLNQLAWMCACCDRELDAGFHAAQSAAQLRPNDWQVLDTLAEVRFRRGDRAAAVDIEKHAMSISSDAYLARQLKRFQSAQIPPTTQPGMAPE